VVNIDHSYIVAIDRVNISRGYSTEGTRGLKFPAFNNLGGEPGFRHRRWPSNGVILSRWSRAAGFRSIGSRQAHQAEE